MLPELLVIYSCVNSIGCPETAAAYGSYHPEIETISKEVSKDYPKLAIISSYISAIYQKKAKIGINSNLQLQLSEKPSIIYTKNF
jgi:hypothetical protein